MAFLIYGILYIFLVSVGSYVTYITLPCIWSVKIAFSLDSDAKYHEDQEKKRLHFFISRENVQNGEIQDGRRRI